MPAPPGSLRYPRAAIFIVSAHRNARSGANFSLPKSSQAKVRPTSNYRFRSRRGMTLRSLQLPEPLPEPAAAFGPL
jgi:hypothetical protein